MWDNHQLLRRIANVLLIASMGVLLYSVWFWFSHSPYLPIKQIRVEGELERLSGEQIRFVAENELKGMFFTVDLDSTRQAFEKLPWVRRATVRRKWPDRLEVLLEEHKAIARLNDTHLLSIRGERFEAVVDDSLPRITAPAGSEKEIAARLVRFADILASAGLKPQELKMAARQAWEIRLQNGILLRLGRVSVEERLQRFAEQWTQTLSSLPQDIDYVDLRYPNGFAVRMLDKKMSAGKPEGTG